MKRKSFTLSVKGNEQDTVISELQGIKKELSGIKKKGAKQVMAIIVSIVVTLIIGATAGVICGRNWDNIMMKIKPLSYAKETITIIESKLEEEAKLNTGLYTAKAHYDSGTLVKDIPVISRLTKKSFSFDYSGTVEAGIKDLSKTQVEVNSQTNIITIKLPAIEITNINVDVSSLTNTQQTSNVFNQLTIEDFNRAQMKLQNNLKTQALKSDIIATAQSSAEKTLRALFGSAVVGYNIEFIWGEG